MDDAPSRALQRALKTLRAQNVDVVTLPPHLTHGADGGVLGALCQGEEEASILARTGALVDETVPDVVLGNATMAPQSLEWV
jgi:hypothetical protein